MINSSLVNHSSSTTAEESLNVKLEKGQRERRLNGISRIGGLATFAMENQATNGETSMMSSSQISQHNINQEIHEIDKNLCDINFASHEIKHRKNKINKN